MAMFGDWFGSYVGEWFGAQASGIAQAVASIGGSGGVAAQASDIAQAVAITGGTYVGNARIGKYAGRVGTIRRGRPEVYEGVPARTEKSKYDEEQDLKEITEMFTTWRRAA